MRGIEFRGEDLYNHKWVYGSLKINTYIGKVFILVYNRGKWCQYGVIPETVGQYTGLKDRNGVKIFEGDIVQYKDGNRYEIVYSTDRNDSHAPYEHFIGAYQLKDSNGHYQMICWITRPYDFASVIGNIHDNPELLEEKK